MKKKIKQQAENKNTDFQFKSVIKMGAIKYMIIVPYELAQEILTAIFLYCSSEKVFAISNTMSCKFSLLNFCNFFSICSFIPRNLCIHNILQSLLFML